MKRLRVFIILLLVFWSVNAKAAGFMTLKYDGTYHKYSGSIFSLVVNNKPLNYLPVPPIIFNDRALVPIREIFEGLGASVSYDGSDRRIEVVQGNTYIRMFINDNMAYVNGKKTAIPDNVVPKLISIEDGETKTMVPIRFISETIGIDVEFSSEHEAILVNSPEYDFSSDEEVSEPVETTVPVILETPIPTPIAIQNPKPTPKPTPKPIIKDVSNIKPSKDTIEVHIKGSSSISGHSTFTMSSPERVVTDLYGFSLSDIDDINVDSGGFSSIRLGDNGERARVVIDINGTIADYSATEVSDTELVIRVQANQTSATSKPVSTPKPSATAKPTAKPGTPATPRPTTYPAYPSSAKLIVIDSGHGGKDSGAVGTLDDKQILEKNLTLQIANKVKEILTAKGYTVDMTRSTDKYLALTEPPAQANEENAAVFVSIHINSADSKEAEGTEVYYSLENNGDSYGTSSSVLAKNILSRMLYYMESTDRGVKTANHAVTRRCNMPAVLVEVGFISNEDELKKMCSSDYQYKAAQGIAEGIIKTLAKIEIPEKEDN